MNPFMTHGAISWSELATTDPAKAVAFYKKVFGWEVQTMPMPTGDYNVATRNGIRLAGIMQIPDPSMPTAWIFYVTVEDAHATAKKAKQLGGTLIMEPMEVPMVGTMVGIQDPTGAVIMAIAYADQEEPDEDHVNFDFASTFQTPGMFSWFELRTPDVPTAISFYKDLFGWRIEAQEMPMGTYNVCYIGEVGFGGILEPPQTEVPPHWGGYVTVDDVDATNKTIEGAGGTIAVPGIEAEGVGKFNMFQDPTGAWLSAIKYAPMVVEE